MDDGNSFEVKVEKLYELYYLDVYKFLICFIGNRDDAEDLTQEVFIRVIKSYSNYNDSGSIKTWIFSIAKHAAIDLVRRKRFISVIKENFFNQLPSAQKTPYEVLQNNENKRILYSAISALKPNYRIVIILRAINEFSIKETAEILNCKESKVKVDYHRALNKLKKELHINSEEVLNNAN